MIGTKQNPQTCVTSTAAGKCSFSMYWQLPATWTLTQFRAPPPLSRCRYYPRRVQYWGCRSIPLVPRKELYV